MSSILESYFNDLNLADLNGQDSWSGDASFDVSTAGAKEGRRGVENADTSGSNKDISKTGSQRNDGRIAIYLKRTNTTGQTLLVLNEGNDERVAVGLGSDGHIKYRDSGGSYVNLGTDKTYSANTWYLIEVEWRSSDHKIRILVDGTLKQDWISPASNWTSYLDKVILRVNQSSGTSYWDYISEFGTSVNTSNWSYAKKYKIDQTKIDEDLTDFQVLVKIDNTKPNYQHFFDNAGTGGASVRFVSSLGSSQTLLKFEKVRFDATNKKAEYFVKIPSVSSTTDTYFYLLYGRTGALDGSDKTEVYGDEFKAVYHMKDDPDTSHIKDSTINANNGTKKAANEPAEADGKVEKAQDFDGSDDYVSLPNNLCDFSGTFTVSLLAKWNNLTGIQALISKDKDSSNFAFILYALDSKMGLNTKLNNKQSLITHTTSLSTGNWYYIAATIDSSNNAALYVDTTKCTGNLANRNDLGSLRIGETPDAFWNSIIGTIDEVRISNVARSDAWIKADYNSLFDTLITEQLFILANTGSYTLTGINTAIKRSYSLISQAGSYALNGINTGLMAFRKLVSSAGSYTLTGIGAVLYEAYQFILSAGSYTLTGIATGLNRLYTFIISAGSYALTGIEAIFYKAYVLIASVGSYILTGTKAKLTAWIKEILHSATWTKEDTHNTIWHKE